MRGMMNAFCYFLGVGMGAATTIFVVWILKLYPPIMPIKDAPKGNASNLV